MGALAADLSRQTLELVADRGRASIDLAMTRIGERLVEANVIDKVEDVFWLEWAEVFESLESSSDRRARVAERATQAARDVNLPAPEMIGPPLPQDPPRMYLLAEILQLLDR